MFSQLISEFFPDCLKVMLFTPCFVQKGSDRIYKMRCLFVAVGPNARFNLLLPEITCHVVDRARVNTSTRYSPEAPAEGLYQVGLFTSTLSHLYHGYFSKESP